MSDGFRPPASVAAALDRMTPAEAAAARDGVPFCRTHGIRHEETADDFVCPRCEAERPRPPVEQDTLFGVSEDPQSGAIKITLPDEARIGRFSGQHPETARQAAISLYRVSGGQRTAVLEAFESLGAQGATDDEMARLTGALRARTRRQELIEDYGVPIIDSGQRRPSDAGHPAIVWVLA